ncbi:Peroxisome biosynthesis protein pex1, partial [Ascosphaera atra]
MLLPRLDDPSKPTINFGGGILRFDPPLHKIPDAPDPTFGWLLGSEAKLKLEMQPEIVRPQDVQAIQLEGDPIPQQAPEM